MSSQRPYTNFSNWLQFSQPLRLSNFELDIQPNEDFDGSKMQEEDELTIPDSFYVPFSSLPTINKQQKPQKIYKICRKQESTSSILKCLKQQKQKEQQKYTLNASQLKQPQSIFLECQSQGCLKVFTSIYSYQTHYKSKHT